ncbi:Ig-like domain-containing protein [Thermoanaerobacter thermocopriae]|uniref:Ig-like domain-containing protein n=1 Tax=Thermoanaerobacter thermocopriae TaxID=29350 RepID=UPI0006D2A887|nr:Ig-like domain-containing protein [Thermoanaerobacter thermocopriae]
MKKLDNDTYELDGTVMLNNQPVTEVGVPLLVENGTVSDNLPVTDETGHFKVEVAKTDVTKAVAVSVDTAKAPGVTMPMVGIDPIIFGNQAWTDTGIDITTPNMLIRIAATGTWANNLYAKVGTNGTPVKVGANGGYVTGVIGRLYLGPYNATYEDNVDAIIYLDNPKDIGIYPAMSLTANPTQLLADGKSTSTISGQILYGQYPLVDGTVNLTATLGTLNTTAPTTDVTGKYTAMFTSGTTAGTAVVGSSFSNLNQTVSITLQQPIPSIIPPSDIRATSTGIQYTTDGGKTWESVYLADVFRGFVYDSVHQVYIGIGEMRRSWIWYDYIYISKDGINWTKTMQPNKGSPLYSIATDNKGTVVIGGGVDGVYKKETVIFVTSDGGVTWTRAVREVKLNRTYYPYTTYYVSPNYIGPIYELKYSNGQFIAIGKERVDHWGWYSYNVVGTLYSTDGYTWHK